MPLIDIVTMRGMVLRVENHLLPDEAATLASTHLRTSQTLNHQIQFVLVLAVLSLDCYCFCYC